MRRLYHLELAKSDGGAVAITLLRPAEWLDQLDRNANGQVLLTLPELDAAGYAQVVSVDPCPAIACGLGRVVLGTFHHSAGDVYDVRLSDGSQLGVTAGHPVWSVDRGEWVSVGDLEPGETLETLDGLPSCGVSIAIVNQFADSTRCQGTVFSAWWHDAQCDRDRMLADFGGNIAGR